LVDSPESVRSQSEIELAPGVFVPTWALRMQFARSSGPGGQNVNKLSTKAELWIPVTALRGLAPDAIERLLLLSGKRLTRDGEIHISSETARTQAANKALALDRLRQLLVHATHRPKPRRKTKPTRASRRRRLDSKRHRAEIKSSRRGNAD
jgi:ribosome-associated protein